MLVEVRGILLFVLLTAVKVYRKDNLKQKKDLNRGVESH